MNEGRIMQIGGPIELYEKPQNRFVASFIGDANLLDATVLSHEEHICRLRIFNGYEISAKCQTALTAGVNVGLNIRPESVHINIQKPILRSDSNMLPAVVEETIYLGSTLRCWSAIGGLSICSELLLNSNTLPFHSLRRGQTVWLTFDPDDVSII
jgi:ABC-type Fe3+/spermidine/putrescine transport system ATPase subunit